jgi:hypothetical protein
MIKKIIVMDSSDKEDVPLLPPSPLDRIHQENVEFVEENKENKENKEKEKDNKEKDNKDNKIRSRNERERSRDNGGLRNNLLKSRLLKSNYKDYKRFPRCEWSTVDNLLDKPNLHRRWIGSEFPPSPDFFSNLGSSESKTVIFSREEEDAEIRKLKKEINNLKFINFLLFISNVGIGLVLLYK